MTYLHAWLLHYYLMQLTHWFESSFTKTIHSPKQFTDWSGSIENWLDLLAGMIHSLIRLAHRYTRYTTQPVQTSNLYDSPISTNPLLIQITWWYKSLTELKQITHRDFGGVVEHGDPFHKVLLVIGLQVELPHSGVDNWRGKREKECVWWKKN